MGEFNNTSLNVFVNGIPYLATYSYRDVCEFVENHFNQPWKTVRCVDPIHQSKSPINDFTQQEDPFINRHPTIFEACEGDHVWKVQEIIHSDSDEETIEVAKNRQYSEVGNKAMLLENIYKKWKTIGLVIDFL